MRSRDYHPAGRPDLSMTPDVVAANAKPRRRTRPLWVYLFILIIAAVYALSPIDFVPDVLPVLGWIDDVVVTISAIMVALPKIVRR